MDNKTVLGKNFDRDKNLTYRPQDESIQVEYTSTAAPVPAENIVNAMLKKHHELRERIQVIKSHESTSVDKQRAVLDLVGIWMAHSQAEENTLYEELANSTELKLTLDAAFEEQAMAQIVIEELEDLNFRLNWTSAIEKKAKTLAEIIEHHLKNDETTYLKLFLSLLSEEDLQLLGHEFTREFEATAAHNKASIKPSRILI